MSWITANSEWFNHAFFCDCKVCYRLKKMGFTTEQAKAIIIGLESAHMDGGDAGGPYTEFDKEALHDALTEMEQIMLKND